MDLLQVIFPVAGIKTYVFIPPAVAFIISFFTSMAGISGAFLLLPFQMSVLGFTTTSVTSTNFLFNVTGTPGGVYRYIKECRFAWPVALTIVAGIIPGVLIGYYIRIKFLTPKDLNQVVSRDDKQLQTIGHHWPLSGPLPKEMRDKIEKIGVCITCHQHIPVGSFTGVHKKSFHDQLMERT